MQYENTFDYNILREESPPGWKGTVRAMLSHHPEKFSKDACKDGGEKGKMCPYALAWSEKKKGDKAHYRNQKSSLKGEPKKKAEFENENVQPKRFGQWLQEHNDPNF